MLFTTCYYYYYYYYYYSVKPAFVVQCNDPKCCGTSDSSPYGGCPSAPNKCIICVNGYGVVKGKCAKVSCHKGGASSASCPVVVHVQLQSLN